MTRSKLIVKLMSISFRALPLLPHADHFKDPMFLRSYIFIKFEKVRYFSQRQLRRLPLSTLTSILTSIQVVGEWLQEFWGFH